MEDGPEKKKRKLTTALKEAIGAHSQKNEENIEKPIALALISDEKSAQGLLNKIQASRRPQALLETTLKICTEKKTEAHVGESFLAIFRKHFAILGIDSAISCWKSLEESLNKSGSLGEIAITCEFISTTNLLGHGFGRLLEIIKSGLPEIIKAVWKQNRKTDSLTLAYSLACLTVAESAYNDNQFQLQSASEYWIETVLTEKLMKDDFGMRMISAMTGCEEHREFFAEPSKISNEQLGFLSKVFLNHLEFYSGVVHPANCDQMVVKNIESHLSANELELLIHRIRSAEVYISPSLHRALVSVIHKTFELTGESILSIEDLNSLRSKDVFKLLPSVLNSKQVSKDCFNSEDRKKLKELMEFISLVVETSDDEKSCAAFSLLAINISIVFGFGFEVCEKILKFAPKEVIEKLVKAAKGHEKETDSVKKVQKLLKLAKETSIEKETTKFVNRSAQEVIDLFASPDTTVTDAITLLQGVHTSEAKKEAFDSIVTFVENLPGGESLDEIKLYKIIVEMYGGSSIESLSLQLVFSRLAADNWTEMDRGPGTEPCEESWFQLLIQLMDLLETIIKSAKNSVLKSFTALFCQLFSHVLKNSQKLVRHSSNAVLSQTLSKEVTSLCVLRRHKIIQDVARLVDSMKRNESYFAMLTASIIGDAVFYGSDSLLAMSKLHSVADKNASALLATNLPVVERTRYKKYLSTITRASKRVY